MATRFIGDTDTVTSILARLAALEAASGIAADADRGDIVTTSGGTVWSFKSSVISTFARTFLNDTDAASVRSTLGLGAMATRDNVNDNDWSGADLAIVNGGTGASSASAARTNLGLAIGSNVQAYSVNLDAFAGRTIGTATGTNIPDAEGVRDLIGATMVAGPGLYSIVNDSGDTVTFFRDDRSCVVLEPYYLPQLTSSGAAYHSIVSTERLVPTYSGALANVGSDIGSGATGLTASAISTLRAGGSALRIATLYDQSGNSRNATQATSARQPGLHDQVLVNGKPWILFDGKRSDLTDQNPHPVGLDLTLSLNSRSNTRIMLIDPTASIIAQEFERCDTSPGKNLYTLSGPTSPYTPVASGNIQYGDASAGVDFSTKLPASPVVLAVRDSSGGQDLFVNGVKHTSATVPASTTLTSFKWGYTFGVSLDQFWANFRGAAYITISGNVSDHDIQQITRCLLFRWGALNDLLPRVVLIGDSISEGVAALLTQNGPFWWRDDIGQPVEAYNWGIAGKFLSDCYADRAATDGTVYVTDRPIVYIIQAGINDIHAGGTAGATVYTSYTTPYIAYLKGLATAAGKTNVRVIVCTLPPQTAHVTTTIETERNNYNAVARANAGGADYVCDYAADPRMGIYPTSADNSALYFDKIHPTALGYSYFGPAIAAYVRLALASMGA